MVMWLTKTKPLVGENYLRAASPMELRCIARESLGFYRALVVGGIYEFSESVDLNSIFTYLHALRQCVHSHPLLSSVVANADSNSAYYESCGQLNLDRHIQILDQHDEAEDEGKAIETTLPEILDAAWPASIPAWRVVVLPLSERRRFIAFSYSHTLGDGLSGFAFHRTFLTAIQEGKVERDLICTSDVKQIGLPFDTPKTLPISWSFLLSPLLATYLPKSIASYFGLKVAEHAVTPGTWTGSPMFHDPEKHSSGIQIISIDAGTVTQVLRICRTHSAKLTGVLHQLIVTALSESLPRPNKIDNFIATTPLSMRSLVDVSGAEMGNFVSVDTQSFGINQTSEIDWALAKSSTEKLAAAAKTLKDQPVGLLRYLNDVRGWTSSKLGQARDSSYEISNIASFQAASSTQRCAIVGMVFSQPANATGAPINFCVASVSNGPLKITASWQIGALGLASVSDEKVFVGKVCERIEAGFEQMVLTSKE